MDSYSLKTMKDNASDSSPAPLDYDAPTMKSSEARATGLKVGDRLVGGRYEILSELGRGGMGVVYRCLDGVAGIEVALKALPPELSHNQDEMEEVRENFQLVSKLIHQNIAASKTLERDDATGDTYLVMELVTGENLRQWMRRTRKEKGTIPLEDALPILRQVAEALDFAHESKVMHRDIKPGNIMLTSDGKVKVMDFGLAAQIHSSLSHVSMAYRGTSGTQSYMAPEQWRGMAQGAPADQYALAVMAYEMLSGHLPFDASKSIGIMHPVGKETAGSIVGLPDSANRALQRALAKSASDRFPSCGEFVDALSGATIRLPSSGKAYTRRVIAGVAVLMSLAGLLFFLTHGEKPKHIETPPVAFKEPAPSSSGRKTETPSAEVGKASFSGMLDLSGVPLKMIRVKAGRFQMGSPQDELGRSENETRHWVTLTRDYWLGETEVTQGQWKAVMGDNPSCFKKGDSYPVEEVSWEKTMDFCEKLNERYRGKLPPGYEFSLPTEAQWEYACRAGTTTALNSGKDITSELEMCSNLDEVAWYDGNSGGTTHPVAQKRRNAWGFYDMHGNVLEWCRDWYGSYGGDAIDPHGPSSGSRRVDRGGSWTYRARYCRSAYRFNFSPSFRNFCLGFRLALVPVQ